MAGRYCCWVCRLSSLRVLAILLCWIASPGMSFAQAPAPVLMVQRADTGYCRHFAFSHDGRLLATDNGDEVLLWEVSTGRLLSAMEPYLSPEIKHMNTGGTLMAAARAKGTVVFSPDDKLVAVLPVDFANPLNFGPPGAPPSLWNVDSGLPLTTGQWDLDPAIARNPAAPSTPEVETWTISDNRQNVTELLAKGTRLQAMSGDGSVGASRNDQPRTQQHIQILDLKTGRVLRTIETIFNDVLAMTLSHDGRYLAAHSSDRRFVTIWDTATGAKLTEIKQDVQYPSVGQLAFSPDGKWLAVQYVTETALFETATWKRANSFAGSTDSDGYGGLVFSPDSRELAIAGKAVSVIEVETGKAIQAVCSSPLHGLTAAAWDPTSGVFALASDKFARIWSPAPDALPITLTSEGTIHALGLSPDGRLALGTRDDDHDVKGHTYYVGDTHIWRVNDIANPIALGRDRLPVLSGASSNSLAFAPGGKTLAAAMLDELSCGPGRRDPACDTDEIPFVGLLTLWDPVNGKFIRQRRQPDPELNVLTFSPDGTQLATGQQAQIVKIYDSATLNRSRAFANPEKEPHIGVDYLGTSALAYSPDGKLLLAGSQNGLVWVLDAAGDNPARIVHEVEDFDPGKPNQRSSAAVVAAFFSPDGKLAYAVQSSGVVWKWKAADWTSAGSFGTQAGAASAALSPNGKVIALANQDGAVRFYAANGGELKLLLASTPGAGSALAVASDGRFDFGAAGDLSLAAYRLGRTTVSVDRLPGNRRVPGLLGEFLKESAVPARKVPFESQP